jgi:nitrate/TMAO reductase-like tetraheme cytochrome c subunit
MPNSSSPNGGNPARGFRLLLVVGAIAVFGLFFFAFAITIASNPTFCGVACHNMNPEWQTWKKSSHAAVTCYGCHGDRSYFTFFKEKIIMDPIGAVSSIRNTYEKPINKESEYSQTHLPANRCLRCHSPENRKFTSRRGLNITSKMHVKHLKAGLFCSTCHNRVVHSGAEKYEPLKSEWEEAKGFKYKDFLTMSDGCRRCHSRSTETRDPETLAQIKNGATPPSLCPTCHTPDFKLPNGHGKPNWSTDHGAEANRNFNYCFDCHDAGKKFDSNGKPWCTVCHDNSKVREFKQKAGLM